MEQRSVDKFTGIVSEVTTLAVIVGEKRELVPS